MKKFCLFIVPALIIGVTLALLILLRVQTVAPLWKGWRVLAVDATISEQQVLAELHKAGVDSVVSLSSKKTSEFPNFSMESIYGTQFSPLLKNETDTYSARLESYFFDEARLCRLYYVPNSPSVLKKTEKALTQIGARWGIDEQTAPPIIPPLLCTLLTALLLFAAKNRTVFLCLQLPFLLVTFLAPAAAICAAACFTGFSAFCVQLVWRKPSALVLLKKSVLLLFMCISCAVIAFSGGIFFLFLFLLSGVCALSAAFLEHHIYLAITVKRSFNPLLLRPARKKDFTGKRFFDFLLISSGCALCMVLAFSFFSRFLPSAGISLLSIPAPIRYTVSGGFDTHGYTEVQKLKQAGNFPAFDDFVRFAWNSAVFPYVRLTDGLQEPRPDARVEFLRYEKSKNGTVTANAQEVLVFNSSFINKLINDIDKQETPTVESIFRAQERFFTAGYTASGGNTRTYGSLPISVIIVVIIVSFAGIILFRANKWLK